MICSFRFVKFLLFFQRERKIIKGYRVIRLIGQGLAVMTNGGFVVILGRQGKAQGVLDQSPGLGGFAIGISALGGQLEAVEGLSYRRLRSCTEANS